MRSLTIKLTIAFLLVSLTGTALAAIIIQQRTRSEFDRFLLDQNRGELVSSLTGYYSQTGNWSGVESVMRQFLQVKRAPDQSGTPGFGRGRPPEMLPASITLLDASGVIVYSRTERPGRQASAGELDRSLPLEVDGEEVGWLLMGPFPANRFYRSPEGVFLERINQAIIIGALVAAILALILGAILARTLTRPIRELTNATQIVAKGDFGYQVEVRSKDELGDLASSFNLMSTDLEQATRVRKQMTADIAHDLRTPVSLILGYTEALSDGKLDGTEEIFGVMHNEALHLSRLIDDLRTLSLADAGELPLNLQQVSPLALLERTAASFKPAAKQRKISLSLVGGEDIPAIEVDPERMAQVLGNLVGNALRYTPEGGQVILSALSNEGGVDLQVQDNGAGIAPEDLPNVFKRFYRGDKSRQQNGAAGLGLAIVKSLVETQGGVISVASELNQGTTFTIRFPV